MAGMKSMLGWIGGSRSERVARIALALHSLQARGLVEAFRELPDRSGYVLQWARGNFGHRVTLDASGREIIATPVALGVGPFGGSNATEEIRPMLEWLPVASESRLGRVRQLGHTGLIEAIRLQGLEHPCLAWFASRVQRLAEGQRLKASDPASMVLLGARKFFKTIPNTDRLNERIPAAVLALLELAAREKRNARKQGDQGEEVLLFSSSPSGHARALLEYLGETHPMETRQAVRKHAMR